ncbi:MAG TPA: hypothetical protein VIJ51_06815 [Solirubrobacteraceae bacterium]
MSEFVEECRREWKRLRVADSVANEMAADLAADLAEAEADGASPEQVLGSGAFDPRSFAASWAAARGVIAPPPASLDPRRRTPRLRGTIAVTALIATILVGLALFTGRSGSTQVAVAAPVNVQPVPVPQSPPSAGFRHFPLALNQHAGVLLPAFGLLILLVGVVGLILWVIYWSPWAEPIRAVRRRSSIDDGPGYG